MIADLKPYPAIKDSGVPSLGEVPKHWEVRKLRHILKVVTERNRPDLPLLSVVRETGVVVRDISDKDENHNFIPDDLTNYKVVQRGFFAMNKMKAWQGSYGVSKYDGIVSPAYFVFKVNGVNSDYFHTALRSKSFVPYFTQASDGVRIGQWDLSLVRMREIPVLLPSLSEQTAIVRFLNHANRLIRRYIRAKQKLIGLLEEQKQAIIREAVTGQIDVSTGRPYPAYKDSGVRWLGKVPEHWEVVQLRRVAVDRCDGPFGSGLKSLHYTRHGIRVVRLQNIGHGEFKSSDVACISPEHYSSLGDHSVMPGDILVAGLGDDNHPAGRACVAPENIAPAMVKADCFRFRPDRHRVEPRFVALQLTSTAATASALLSTGATRQRTNLQSTSSRAITIPTIHEQSLVVEYSALETSTIRSAQETAIKEMVYLREYRTRLTADVVTGKLDVREAAARLPEADPLGDEDVVETVHTDVDSNLEERKAAQEMGL